MEDRSVGPHRDVARDHVHGRGRNVFEFERGDVDLARERRERFFDVGIFGAIHFFVGDLARGRVGVGRKRMVRGIPSWRAAIANMRPSWPLPEHADGRAGAQRNVQSGRHGSLARRTLAVWSRRNFFSFFFKSGRVSARMFMAK